MGVTLRPGSWAPPLLLMAAAVGVAAVLGLEVGGLIWWIGLAAWLVLGLGLGWRERERKLRALNSSPRPAPPPLRLIEGGKARERNQADDPPAKPVEKREWLM